MYKKRYRLRAQPYPAFQLQYICSLTSGLHCVCLRAGKLDRVGPWFACHLTGNLTLWIVSAGNAGLSTDKEGGWRKRHNPYLATVFHLLHPFQASLWDCQQLQSEAISDGKRAESVLFQTADGGLHAWIPLSTHTAKTANLTITYQEGGNTRTQSLIRLLFFNA